MSGAARQLVIAGTAGRDIEGLAEKYAAAVVELLPAIAANPKRLGKPLESPLHAPSRAPERRRALRAAASSVARIAHDYSGSLRPCPARPGARQPPTPGRGADSKFELEGFWAAQRGPYRVIYAIEEEAQIVRVLAIAHRADVYRQR